MPSPLSQMNREQIGQLITFYDVFVNHAPVVSVSAYVRRLRHEPHKTVVIIGDGGGVATVTSDSNRSRFEEA